MRLRVAFWCFMLLCSSPSSFNPDCHARYLNLWMRDNPFSLVTLKDLARYVTKDSFQTVLDDKSGYDHIFLTQSSRFLFGIQWGGWFFTYNTLPFGWKVSPFIYHTKGLLVTS